MRRAPLLRMAARDVISERSHSKVKGLTRALHLAVMTGTDGATKCKAYYGMTDSSDKGPLPPRHADTRVVTAGRHPPSYYGFINPPVYHASTLLYPSAADYVAHRGRYQYGRVGTPTTEALETAMAELEGPQCAGVALLPSGLAAISTALLAVLKAGDHLLVTDSAYGPTRAFCEQILPRFGIATSFYDPAIGAGIAA